MLVGIDVSFWQGAINWEAVRAAGYRFAFTKATESGNFFDSTFYRNVSGAQAAEVAVGAYHFYRLAAGAREQAEFFLSKIAPLKLDLPPVLDFEEKTTLNQAQAAGEIKTWLDIVEHETGRKPIIYTSGYFWNTYIGAPPWAGQYRLWVANYTTGAAPLLPAGWTSWLFWQYTNQGSVPGIAGYVDINRAMLSERELDELTGKAITVEGGENRTIEERVAALEARVLKLKQVLQSAEVL